MPWSPGFLNMYVFLETLKKPIRPLLDSDHESLDPALQLTIRTCWVAGSLFDFRRLTRGM